MAWTAEQIRNAKIIYEVGQRMGLGARDIQIALIAAMVESSLRNLNYGDRDSLGLFQQRPSQGWGTPEQILNPEYAAKQFYQHLVGLGSRRLQMGMGEAAQAVQRSAYPDRYATFIPEARNLYPTISWKPGDPVTVNPDDAAVVAQYSPGGSASATTVPAEGIQMYTPTSDQMLGSELIDPGIPSASVMLGAWGMSSPQPADPIDPLAVMNSGAGTFISQGTNPIVQQTVSTEGPVMPGVDGWRKQVIAAAKGALGTPYVWGGTSLANGVDCSGLVMAAFARAGINLPRISYQQANSGQRVGIKGLRPGDLVAWDNSSRNNGADHIAIYLGNGMIIEAPRPGLSVRIRRLGPNLEGGWGVHLNF